MPFATEKIALITDSACDASDADLAELGVECVHLTVSKPDGKTFPQDNSDENIEAFYDYIADCDELPSTSQPSPLEFAELFSRLDRKGYTHAICMHISSAMSGTFGTARMAAQSTSLTVEVIDTHCNTVAQYLFVRRIAQLRQEGATFAQLVAYAHRLEGKCSVCFMLDTLRNLVMGGRTGKAVGLAASLLNIKPLLTVDEDGEVSTIGKVKSLKKAAVKLAAIAKGLNERLGDLEVCFVHVRRLEGVALIRTAFEEAGVRFSEIGVRQTGPVITTHVSVGCVGFAYIPVEV